MAAAPAPQAVVRALLGRCPRTFAEQAGISLRDKPSPLYRLLVLSTLLSTRISADIAVAAARELGRAGMRTPRAMAGATWQQRVNALGRARYRRYDESTATRLGDGAALLLERDQGDLRRLHRRSEDTGALRAALEEFPGIGPTGSAIFCREVQGVWPGVAPFLDDRAVTGAERLGLPTTPGALAKLVARTELPVLASALVLASKDDALVEAVRGDS